ncbi:MAG: hypothetical protein R2754_07975 [Microthrixaceae bacterium]
MSSCRSLLSMRVAACVVAIPLVLGACGQGDGQASDSADGSDSTVSAHAQRLATPSPLPTPVQELDIDGNEYTFKISPDPTEPLKPGWTLLRFHNVGVEAHQVMFARIKDGVDMSELAEAGANDSSGAGAIEFVDMIGGVSYIDGDYETTALVNLEEGTVMAMCYVPDAKGTAHALMGMSSALTVAAPSGDAPEPAPELDDEEALGTIEMSEDGYLFPEQLETGWYQVKNTDTALHELSLLRLERELDDDATEALVQDLADNKAPSVKLDAVGGMGAISPGFDGYLYLDLEPGNYLTVDFMPDPGEPRPHMLDGYYATFSV